ncbi:hypothetical protein [Pectobacterium versatile]|uniref:hypothetical protein n=1 Tax=Pectobacterium versatile TaxID=2488639 RepID=UPI00398C62A5
MQQICYQTGSLPDRQLRKAENLLPVVIYRSLPYRQFIYGFKRCCLAIIEVALRQVLNAFTP